MDNSKEISSASPELNLMMKVRNTKWDDSDVELKLEKLRRELLEMRHLPHRVQNLSNQIESVMNHEHGLDGKVLVSPHNRSFGGGSLTLGSEQRIDPLA